MKLRFRTFSMLLAAGATLALTGCKDDMMGEDQLAQEYNGKYYHITAGIALPGIGTRSGTDGSVDDDGTETTPGDTNSDEEKDSEFGWAYENEIRTMILLYTNSKDEYIAHSVITGLTKAPEENITKNYDYVVVGEVKHQDLEDAYKEGGALYQYNPNATDGSGDIHVYAFCNYTDRLASLFGSANKATKATWREWEGIINEDPSPIGHTPSIQNTIWAPRSFLMTNARIANVKFPDEIGKWDNYADKSNPWILNSDGSQISNGEEADPDPIYVERTAARIDFRDGSSDPENTPNTYFITTDDYSYGDWNTEGTGEGALEVVRIELTRMALVNMSKEFYYLRRVSNDGTNSGWIYGGVETSSSGRTPFVVDNDFTYKNGAGYNIEYAEKAFNFPLFRKLTAEEIQAKQAKRRIVGWDPTGLQLDDIQKATEDPYTYNYEGWYCDIINDVLTDELHDIDTWSGSSTNPYHIWRYVTENTLPNADAQQVQQSVGVVFKGRIDPGKDAMNVSSPDFNDKIYEYISKKAIDVLNEVKNKKDNSPSPLLYSFENRLFSGYDDIITAANNIDGEASTLYGAVSRILNNWHAVKNDNKVVYTYNPESNEVEDMLDVKMAYLILDADNQYTEDGVTYSIDNKLTDEVFRAYAPKQNIAVYQASVEKDKNGNDVWGYYCYYFYWNRHNDNLKSGLMGPMEFATVRNNVYKLAVTKIDRLGHPTIPDDDPDPVEEKDPDEPPTNYMRVDVEVLPWVVRVNDIEF